MKELIEELKLNRVAYLLEIMEKKDFDSKINALKKLEKMKQIDCTMNGRILNATKMKFKM